MALCQKSHALARATVPSEWRCDGCQVHNSINSVGYGCRKCDVDACPQCADRRCPKGHFLIVASPPANEWGCDGCGRHFGGPSCGCRACDYDLCLSCGFRGASNIVTSPAAPVAPAAVPTWQAAAAASLPPQQRPPTQVPVAPPVVQQWQASALAAQQQQQWQPAAQQQQQQQQQWQAMPAAPQNVSLHHATPAAPLQQPQSTATAAPLPRATSTRPSGPGRVPVPPPVQDPPVPVPQQPTVEKPAPVPAAAPSASGGGGFFGWFRAAPVAAASQPSVVGTAARTDLLCPQGHGLSPNQPPGDWVCDACRKEYKITVPSIGCRKCDVDVCASCASHDGCAKRHVLMQSTVPGDWNCDRCSKSFPKSALSHGCRKCDFDCCTACYEASKSVVAPAPVSTAPNSLATTVNNILHQAPSAPAPSQAAPSYPAATPAAPMRPHQPAPQQRMAGKFRSLFIGINYKSKRGQLDGCINDVFTVRNIIQTLGFEVSESRVLVDDADFPLVHAAPTRKNVIDSLRWLRAGAAAGDNLFLHYSGHGTRVPSDDDDGGFNEGLVPCDYELGGPIRDDDIFAFLCKDLPAGVRLTCVTDCCHTGAILDLPYEYRWSNETQQPVGRLKNGKGYARERSTAADVLVIASVNEVHSQAEVQQTGTAFLAEYHGPGKAGGPCSNALAPCFAGNPSINYGHLLMRIQEEMRRRRFQQIAIIAASKPVDVNRPVSLIGTFA